MTSVPGLGQPCDCHQQLPERVGRHRTLLHKEMGLAPLLTTRRSFHLGDGDVHYEYFPCSDQAPWLIFLPGIGTYAELYAELLNGLARSGYNVVALDYPGHGFSGGRRGVYEVDDVCRAVSALVDAIESVSQSPVHVFGYSIGGMLAVAAAEQDPRIRAVVAQTLLVPDVAPDVFHQMGWFWVSGSSWLFPDMKIPLSNIVDYDRLLQSNPAGPYLKADPLCIYSYPLRTLNSLFSWHARFIREPVDFPILVLHGEDDEILPLEYAEKVRDRSQAAMCVHALSGGHMLPWDDPAGLVHALDSWLSTLAAV